MATIEYRDIIVVTKSAQKLALQRARQCAQRTKSVLPQPRLRDWQDIEALACRIRDKATSRGDVFWTWLRSQIDPPRIKTVWVSVPDDSTVYVYSGDGMYTRDYEVLIRPNGKWVMPTATKYIDSEQARPMVEHYNASKSLWHRFHVVLRELSVSLTSAVENDIRGCKDRHFLARTYVFENHGRIHMVEVNGYERKFMPFVNVIASRSLSPHPPRDAAP